MSYSFNIRAGAKWEAHTLIQAELDKVAASQPLHANDREQAEKVAEIFLAVLPDDPDQDIAVSMHGSIGSIDGKVSSAGVGITVSHVARA
ncbi:hypothetical protein [Novosphingobium clariflavum]|uniref:Uncharacterized protein n=1 Tax=Novosphingobium clariflavum TaxID=2029884 RepID=A0ABV6SEC3_9SPHN|nr:hypothetical protein [Novosphingobium clariflavum]